MGNIRINLAKANKQVVDMGKHHNSSGKIQKNVASTIDTIVQVSGSQKNENAGYFPKDGSHKYYGFPLRKWTTTEKLIAVLAAGVVIGGGHDILKKNKSTKKYVDNLDSVLGVAFDFIYKQLPGIPGYDNNPAVGMTKTGKTVPANASAAATPQVSETPQPNYDYYDEEFRVGIVIEGDSQFKQHN